MITKLRLENFKSHRDTTLVLPQFAVLVGDNGSGKTSVLEAIRLPDDLVANSADASFDDDGAFDELLRRGAEYTTLSFEGKSQNQVWANAITVNAPDPRGWRLEVQGSDSAGRFFSSRSGTWLELRARLERAKESTGHVALYRLRADQVAASAYSSQTGTVVANDGALTAVVLAGLKLADDEMFDRIESAMRRLIPSFRRLRIKPAELLHPSNPNPVVGSKLYFDFEGAKDVPAHHASQGTLVVVALLTVLHGPDRPKVILLDDFDHALHPRAQMELVRMIKELLAQDTFKDTQIVATTHSPYVLDELAPENVIAFALREDGSVASKPLSEHPDAATVRGSLKAGELWSMDAERDWVR